MVISQPMGAGQSLKSEIRKGALTRSNPQAGLQRCRSAGAWDSAFDFGFRTRPALLLLLVLLEVFLVRVALLAGLAVTMRGDAAFVFACLFLRRGLLAAGHLGLLFGRYPGQAQ